MQAMGRPPAARAAADAQMWLDQEPQQAPATSRWRRRLAIIMLALMGLGAVAWWGVGMPGRQGDMPTVAAVMPPARPRPVTPVAPVVPALPEVASLAPASPPEAAARAADAESPTVAGASVPDQAPEAGKAEPVAAQTDAGVCPVFP